MALQRVRKGSSGRRFSVELEELIARHHGNSAREDEDAAKPEEKEIEDADDGKPGASKLFLESGPCLYLCMSDEKRMDIHDSIVSQPFRLLRDCSALMPLGALLRCSSSNRNRKRARNSQKNIGQMPPIAINAPPRARTHSGSLGHLICRV